MTFIVFQPVGAIDASSMIRTASCRCRFLFAAGSFGAGAFFCLETVAAPTEASLPPLAAIAPLDAEVELAARPPPPSIEKSSSLLSSRTPTTSAAAAAAAALALPTPRPPPPPGFFALARRAPAPPSPSAGREGEDMLTQEDAWEASSRESKSRSDGESAATPPPPAASSPFLSRTESSSASSSLSPALFEACCALALAPAPPRFQSCERPGATPPAVVR